MHVLCRGNVPGRGYVHAEARTAILPNSGSRDQGDDHYKLGHAYPILKKGVG